MSQKTKDSSTTHSVDSPLSRRVGGARPTRPPSMGGKNVKPPKRTAEIGRVAPEKKKELPCLQKSKHTELTSAQSGQVLDAGFVSGDSIGRSNSATAAKLERELADLRKENTALKKELTEIRTLHEQLIHETPEEKFSEKRVNLLKSQIVQLERQVLLMTRALGTRGELLVDLVNMMEWLEEREKSSSFSDVDALQRIATLKLRLSKYMQTGTVEKLAEPVRFLDNFIKPKKTAMQGASEASAAAVTLVDVCRAGAIDSVNIKHVVKKECVSSGIKAEESRLESKLAELFGQLVQLKASLETAPPRTGVLFQPIKEHCCNHVTKCCKLIGECCHNLLCLSLLLPTAPWPPLRGNEVSLSFSVNDVLKHVPSSVKNKKEVRQSLEAAMVAFRYSMDMQVEKCKAVESELQFHKAAYDLQAEYVDSLIKSVSAGYEEFEQSLQELVCSPIETLLASFDTLSQSGSEDAWREFLSSFKQSYPELKDAVRRIRKVNEAGSTSSKGMKALSLFGQQFFQQLHKLEEKCNKQRKL